MAMDRSDVAAGLRAQLANIDTPAKFGDRPPPAAGGAAEKAAHRTASSLIPEHAHLPHDEAVPAIIARVRDEHPEAQVSDDKLGVRIRRGLKDHAKAAFEAGTAGDDDSGSRLGDSLRRIME